MIHEAGDAPRAAQNTGTLVREAVRLGGLVVTDRGAPIARIEPTIRQRVDILFKHRRILPDYQELLNAGALPVRFEAARTVRR